jgi:Calx-beta domain
MRKIRGLVGVCALAVFCGLVLPARGGASLGVVPSISISSAAVTEGDTGLRSVKLLVSLSKPTNVAVTATAVTAIGTANGVASPTVAGGDFVLLTKTMTFSPGQVAKSIGVKLLPDATIEGAESFTVELSGVVGADIGDGIGTVTIEDDDVTVGFRISIGDVTIREGGEKSRSVTVPVHFSEAAPSSFVIAYQTIDGSADGVASAASVPPGDYRQTAKTAVVLAGRRESSLSLALFPDNSIEGPETLTISISAPSVVVADSISTVTILDDAADNQAWTTQVGPVYPSPLYRTKATVDSDGNTYVTGTGLSWPGISEPGLGAYDVFVAKYGPDGSQLWAHRLSSSAFDESLGIVHDGGGGAIVAGRTVGNLPGAPEPITGGNSAFLAKYSATGSLAWVHQFQGGATGLDSFENPAVHPNGDIVVTDEVPDETRVVRYDATGVLLSNTLVTAVTPLGFGYAGTAGFETMRFDSDGNIIETANSLGGDELIIRKSDAGGAVLWTRSLSIGAIPIETVGNNGLVLDVDDNIIVTAQPVGGDGDSFVAKYEPDGDQAWLVTLTNEAATAATPVLVRSAAVDAAGNVFAIGTTYGDLAGASESGDAGRDEFIVKLGGFDGALIWAHQHGSPSSQHRFDSREIGVDAAGDAIVVGWGNVSGYGALPMMGITKFAA